MIASEDTSPGLFRSIGQGRRWISKPDPVSLLLAGIVAAGAVLRLWGLHFGLPMTRPQPDEAPWVIRVAWGFGRGDFNPHTFFYPTFFVYVLFGIFSLYYAVGRVTQLFSRSEFIASYTLDPSPFFLLGRGLAALAGICTIYLIYELGRRAYSRGVGVLAALFTAFAFLHVRDSHFAKTDIALTFWIVLAYLFILRIATGGCRRDAIMAGVFVGLGASTKYNALMMGIPLILAHALHAVQQRTSWRDLLRNPDIYLSGLAAFAAMIATSPFILLDYKTFLRDFRTTVVTIREIQATQFPQTGPGWIYHARFTLPNSLGLGLCALSATGALYALVRRRAPDLLLLSFSLVYYAVAGSGWVVAVRYILPLIPLLCLLAARALWEAAGWVSLQRRPALAAGMAILCVLDPAYRSVLYDQVLCRKDTRLLAAEWVAAHVPPGSKVALGGNIWGRPDLLESPEVLQDRLRAIRQEGGEGSAVQSLLNSPRYRARPSHFVVSIGDSISPLRGGGPAIPNPHIDRLLTERIDYLIVNTHPHLKHYGAIEPGLADFLSRHPLTPVATFTPTDGAEYPPPVFDPIDAFYVPLSRYGNTVRPGPCIQIYRLNP